MMEKPKMAIDKHVITDTQKTPPPLGVTRGICA